MSKEDIWILKDLIEDRKSFLTGDPEDDEVWLRDIQALENAIKFIEERI